VRPPEVVVATIAAVVPVRRSCNDCRREISGPFDGEKAETKNVVDDATMNENTKPATERRELLEAVVDDIIDAFKVTDQQW
jgi:hypothetical protein